MDTQTIATYDAHAQMYDEETQPFWDIFPRTFLDAFVAASGKKVLDVGSGPGRDGLLLKEAGKQVTCLDASAEMVALSQASGLESVQGDFNELPFEDESFDAVWSYTAFLHVPKKDVGEAFAETHRVLVPGGVLGLGLIEGADELYRDTLGGKSRWFSYYSQEEVEQMLSAHGFIVEYFEAFQAGKSGRRRYMNFVAKKL